MLNIFCKYFHLSCSTKCSSILIFPFDEMLKLFLKLILSLWKFNSCKNNSTKSSLSITIIPKCSHTKKLWPTKSKLFPFNKIAAFSLFTIDSLHNTSTFLPKNKHTKIIAPMPNPICQDTQNEICLDLVFSFVNL